VSLESRVATLTREGAELLSKLGDEDLQTWIQHHARLLDAAVMEVSRRKDSTKGVYS